MTSSPAGNGLPLGPDEPPNADTLDVIETVEDGVYYASHDMARDGLATTVALAVAAVDGSSPTALVSDFASYVDPDGLNRIFRTRPDGSSCTEGHVQLDIDGYRVRIDSDGEIAITPPATSH